MKTETCKLYSRVLEHYEYFCQISSKSIHTISSHTVSKLGRFLRHSVDRFRCKLRPLCNSATNRASYVALQQQNISWNRWLIPVSNYSRKFC